MSAIVCGTPTECPRHPGRRVIYYCVPCHEAWAAASPRTVAAIHAAVAGRGSYSAIDAATREDAQARRNR